jgi:hypothetical protein
MLKNRSVPTDAVLPHITYENVAEAIVWLTGAFGFVEHYCYGQPVAGAQMSLGRAWIMLSGARPGPLVLPKQAVQLSVSPSL